MPDAFDPKPWYNPERDGDLASYLKIYNGFQAFPLFKGYEHFEMLWNAGYLVPQESVIRLMWNVRQDEHFLVGGQYELIGIDNIPAHAGRPGVHDPRELLEGDCPPWEAHYLSPQPKPRVSK